MNNIPPFYIGQKVIGSGTVHPLSKIKKGQPYVISHCHYSINPANGTGPYWYIGIEGHHDWLAPRLVVPIIEEFKKITFEKITEDNPISVN